MRPQHTQQIRHCHTPQFCKFTSVNTIPAATLQYTTKLIFFHSRILPYTEAVFSNIQGTFSSEVKNKWSHAATPPTSFYDVYRDFTFLPFFEQIVQGPQSHHPTKNTFVIQQCTSVL